MSEYHKIDTVYKRDPATNFKTLLLGDYSQESFAYLANNQWAFSEKVDGCHIRILIHDGHLSFGGKTSESQIPARLIARLEERFLPQKDTLLDIFADGACLYGEGYGAKIQKGGGNYRPDQDFVLFDVRVGPWWLKRPDVESVAQQFGLDVVPIIGVGTLSEMVKMAMGGFMSVWGNFLAEGIVARPTLELYNRDGGRIITKIKHRDFRAVQAGRRS